MCHRGKTRRIKEADRLARRGRRTRGPGISGNKVRRITPAIMSIKLPTEDLQRVQRTRRADPRRPRRSTRTRPR